MALAAAAASGAALVIQNVYRPCAAVAAASGLRQPLAVLGAVCAQFLVLSCLLKAYFFAS